MDSIATREELEAGRGYEALFVPSVFACWTRHLIDGADVKAGSDVLDVACGTGVLARHALSESGASGRVAGIDPAPGMIAAASEIEPAIEWTLGTAEELPFDDAAFDCVVSQFGMMFFADRDAAAREMFRVARPGARLAVAVWNSVDHNPAYGDIISVLDEHVGPAAGDALRLPFSLGDSGEVTRVFDRAGFTDIGIETKTEQAAFPGSRTMVEAELRGWLPLFDIRLSEEEIADVLVRSDDNLARYVAESGQAVFPTSAHVLSARKPG